jgi:glycosyltransferase involved in cell wall biosynthesis
MKVLFLTSFITRDQAGAVKAACALANYLSSSRQAEVSLACDRFENGILHEDIALQHLKDPEPLPMLWRIPPYLRRQRISGRMKRSLTGKFDVAYTASVEHAVSFALLHKSTPIFLHAGATISSREILTEGSTSLFGHLHAQAEDRLVRRALRQKNIIHLTSTSLVAQERADFYGVDKSAFNISPYGVDENRFSGGTTYEDIRSKLHVPRDAFVVCTTARLVKWKHIDILLKAVQRCDSKPWLLIVGDGPEMPNLQDLARTLGISEQVRFVGYVEPNAYLAASDLFVLPSSIESFGLAYAEAMTMGLPCIGRKYRPPTVISSACDVIPESAGFLIDDFEELATKIDFLSNNRGISKEMGASARRHAQEHYTTAAYLNRIKRIGEQRFEIAQTDWKRHEP